MLVVLRVVLQASCRMFHFDNCFLMINFLFDQNGLSKVNGVRGWFVGQYCFLMINFQLLSFSFRGVCCHLILWFSGFLYAFLGNTCRMFFLFIVNHLVLTPNCIFLAAVTGFCAVAFAVALFFLADLIYNEMILSILADQIYNEVIFLLINFTTGR